MREHHFDYLNYDPSKKRLDPTIRKGETKTQDKPLPADEVFCIDICSRKLVTCQSRDNLSDVFRRMQKHELRHLPVLEGDRFIGIISLKDILPHIDKPFLEKLVVGDYISKIVICCDEETPVRYIAHVLCEEHVSALPVVDSELKLTGIISYVDVLKSLI